MNNFDFTTEHILENENVLLRPLQMADYDLLLEYALNEPGIWQYSLISAAGADNLKAYIQSALKAREDKKEYPFIVYDKAKQKYIGSTRFYDIQLNNETLQLGYTWYGAAAQGTGLNRQCKYLMLAFAFEKMAMLRVEFRADNKNERSINAMKSIGCTVEGVLRSNCATPNGQRRDSIVLSILQHEWHDTVKEMLKNKIRSNSRPVK